MMAETLPQTHVDISWVPALFINSNFRRGLSLALILSMLLLPTTILMASDHYLQDPATLDYSHRLFVAGMCCALVVYLITMAYWAWGYEIFRKVVGLCLKVKVSTPAFDFLVFTFTKASAPQWILFFFVCSVCLWNSPPPSPSPSDSDEHARWLPWDFPLDLLPRHDDFLFRLLRRPGCLTGYLCGGDACVWGDDARASDHVLRLVSVTSPFDQAASPPDEDLLVLPPK